MRKHTCNYNFDSDFVTKVIINSSFDDDFTGREDTIEKDYLLLKKLNLRFFEGRFNLRKWRTNDKDLSELIDDSENSIKLLRNLGV